MEKTPTEYLDNKWDSPAIIKLKPIGVGTKIWASKKVLKNEASMLIKIKLLVNWKFIISYTS